MNQKIIPRSFGTHDGTFHADEVTACSLLLVFNLIDKKRILRTRDQDRLAQCEYVCDVGGVYDPLKKRFDHHQPSYCGDLSSAGMVLKDLKDRNVIPATLYDYLNRFLVAGIDAVDTGRASPVIGHCSFSQVIDTFVPERDDANPDEIEKAFYSALNFTEGHLSRLLAKFYYIQECREEIKREMEKNGQVLIFDRSMPWLEVFFELEGEHHPAQFVIMPVDHQWKLRGIPPSYDRRMQVRVPLPSHWAGLRAEDLKKQSGIDGAVFCHKAGFISIWETKQAALKALDYVFNQAKHK